MLLKNFVAGIISVISCITYFYVSAAMADPLQGYAEQSNMPLRIQRTTGDVANTPSVTTGENTALPQTPLVNTDQFTVKVPSTPSSSAVFSHKQLNSQVSHGEDEYWVNWDNWRHRVADAVWAPIKDQQIIIWGTTKVEYDVTRDHHIKITSVKTPDPTGKSGKILAACVMRLDGNRILEFPIGSKQLIHHNYNMEAGLPMPSRTRRTIYLPGGDEHVTNQW